MRILAIRGCNLASLAGEFALELTSGPLAGAGVFAIVGNTGAGKSTLLDALCVALFERTPRLSNRSNVTIGREDDELGVHDVRTLLRRGAAQAWAEVDFEGGDRRRYRARWSVRRARNQPGGALQDPQLKLTSLDDGAALGGTRTETLREIQARLGLSFDQFRRSALLAQGDFAAFLRADGRERSELLERMTGTEIYTRLSIAAHGRATAAEARLRSARAAVEAIAVLDGEARAALEAAAGAAQVALAAARTAVQAAEAAARWRAEAARWAREVAEAAAAHDAAAAAVAAAAPERARLARWRLAEGLRSRWAEVERGAAELAAARHAEGDVAGEVAAVAARIEALAQQRTALASRLAPVQAARQAAGLVERDGPGAIGEAVAVAMAWLSAHAAAAPEVAAHPALAEGFARRRALREAATGVARRLAGIEGRRAEVRAQRAQAEVTRSAVAAQLLEAERHAASLHTRRGLTLDAAGRQEDQARRHQVEIAALVEEAARARAAAAAHGAAVEGGVAAAGREVAAREARGGAERAHAEAKVVQRERARALAAARAAAGNAHARAELRDGEACPLCGATAHPWAARGALDELVAGAQASLDEGDAAVEAAREALAAAAAALAAEVAEVARLAAAAVEAAAALAAARQRWAAILASFGELPLVTDPATAEAAALAEARAHAAARALELARSTRSAVEAAAKAASDAQAAVVARRSEVDHASERIGELDRALTALELEGAQLTAAAARDAARLGEVEATLASGVARWGAVSAEVAATGGALDDPDLPGRIAVVVATWRGHAEVVGAAEAALRGELAAVGGALQHAELGQAAARARQAAVAARRSAAEVALAAGQAALVAGCADVALKVAALPGLLADGAAADEAAARLDALDRAVAAAAAIVGERQRAAQVHGEAAPPELGGADALPARSAALIDAEREAAARAVALASDDAARARRAEAEGGLASALVESRADLALGEVIGSHDGKALRSFAQSLTLDALLAVANTHLDELAPRYQLARVPRHDLELQVVDRELADEVRSIHSLSGGESFLASLALALALSSLAAHDVRVRTLFIDEGFGTLDPATLDSALAVLDALQATGRQVGIISHVPALIERVGGHVRVIARGAGRSEVVVAER